MGCFDVTRIAESELLLVLKEMQECSSKEELDELNKNAEDCLSAFYHSLLARL
jgi:hypothetical protein